MDSSRPQRPAPTVNPRDPHAGGELIKSRGSSVSEIRTKYYSPAVYKQFEHLCRIRAACRPRCFKRLRTLLYKMTIAKA